METEALWLGSLPAFLSREIIKSCFLGFFNRLSLIFHLVFLPQLIMSLLVALNSVKDIFRCFSVGATSFAP